MAAPTDEQSGIRFLAKVGFERSITAVDTTNDTVTFDDTDQAVGNELEEGDTVSIEGSTGNDGDYTIATGGIDLGTADETTVTTDESISDSTADGNFYFKPKIGGSTSATRTRTTSMVSVTNKDSSQYQEQVAATQEETIEADAMFLESDEEQTGQGVSVELDSGSGFNSLQGVNSVTITVNMELITVANGDTSRWAEREPSTRGVEYSIDRDYIDPENDTAYDELLTAFDNGNTIDLKITLQTFEITFAVDPTEEGVEAPFDGLTTSPLTLQSNGSETTISRANQQNGIGNLFSGIFSGCGHQMHVRYEHVDCDQAQVSGSTYWEGNYYPSTVEITLPVEDAADASLELMNDGSVTRSTL